MNTSHLRPLLTVLLAGGLLHAAHAQQVFRIVGPDGRVTFSDKPPPETRGGGAGASLAPQTGAGPAPSSGGNAALPFALRGVAQKYPVTIYTGPNCAPCGSARSLLLGRGVPFNEKTVTTNEDLDALQRLSGGLSLLVASIGGQQLKGYSEIEWSQYLDAAGYPKTSQLPGTYRNPAPSPMVAVQAVAPRPAQAAEPAPAPEPPPPVFAPAPGPAPSNPAGIRF